MTEEQMQRIVVAIESLAGAAINTALHAPSEHERAQEAAQREASATAATRARHFALAEAEVEARRALAVATLAAMLTRGYSEDAEIAVERARDLLFPAAKETP